MENSFDKSLAEANSVANSILSGTSVESYGIMHQSIFLDFRNSMGDDCRLHINANVTIVGYLRPENMTQIEYALLCMNKVNLLEVERVLCEATLCLIIHFVDGLVFMVGNETEDDEDVWQLNTDLPVSDGGRSIIALANDGYAVW